MAFYKKYERVVPAISFAAGFLWDNFTLTRIDLLTDNIIIFSYIFIAGFLIMLINFVDEKVVEKPFITKYRIWYPAALQFFFGGLFSSYVVFYFRSATLSKNWIFLLLLVLVLIGNEFVKERLSNLRLQFSVYFLATFSFFIFSLPVFIKKMNAWVFLLSGVLSLAYTLSLGYFIYKKSGKKTFQDFRKLAGLVLIIYFLFHVFYFMRWIPPVPLAMKDGGIYHHVSREDGNYKLRFEKGSWFNFWKTSDKSYHYAEGDTAFCFVSVFAPTSLDKNIRHVWQKYHTSREEWQTTDRLGYKIIGGRDGGYRGYSFKKNISAGKWRVEVKTDDGHLLGRIGFTIISGASQNREFKTIVR